jgi:hypothetical protein
MLLPVVAAAKHTMVYPRKRGIAAVQHFLSRAQR